MCHYWFLHDPHIISYGWAKNNDLARTEMWVKFGSIENKAKLEYVLNDIIKSMFTMFKSNEFMAIELQVANEQILDRSRLSEFDLKNFAKITALKISNKKLLDNEMSLTGVFVEVPIKLYGESFI